MSTKWSKVQQTAKVVFEFSWILECKKKKKKKNAALVRDPLRNSEQFYFDGRILKSNQIWEPLFKVAVYRSHKKQ